MTAGRHCHHHGQPPETEARIDHHHDIVLCQLSGKISTHQVNDDVEVARGSPLAG
jgi:hypothetical protein